MSPLEHWHVSIVAECSSVTTRAASGSLVHVSIYHVCACKEYRLECMLLQKPEVKMTHPC